MNICLLPPTHVEPDAFGSLLSERVTILNGSYDALLLFLPQKYSSQSDTSAGQHIANEVNQLVQSWSNIVLNETVHCNNL